MTLAKETSTKANTKARKVAGNSDTEVKASPLSHQNTQVGASTEVEVRVGILPASTS